MASSSTLALLFLPEAFAAKLFSSEPSVKRLCTSGSVFAKLNLPVTRPADPAALTDPCDVAQQTRFDWKHIVSSHVSAWMALVEDQVLDHTVRHAPVSRRRFSYVQLNLRDTRQSTVMRRHPPFHCSLSRFVIVALGPGAVSIGRFGKISAR